MKIRIEIKLTDKVEGKDYDTTISELNTEVEGEHNTFRTLASSILELVKGVE